VTTSQPDAVVELSIPARPEYVGVARLAILGVASRMRFSYDEVEDIRLAVGEACTSVLDRAEGQTEARPIRIRCYIFPDRLMVEVRDNIPLPERPRPAEGETALDDFQLGGVLIRILMDEVSSEPDPQDGAHLVRMVKYVAR
jgi:serine/threonine-protein kinase RsbW